MGSKYYNQIQANHDSRLHLGDVNYYGDQERLKYVPGALFNAYGQDHQPCHHETRRELLEEIGKWAEHPAGKSIFWLSGMAGTGKSTIAYTVAERLSQLGPSGRAKFGGSFFFKRGESDRASAALFFPTIVRQLRQKIPDLAVHIDQAIDTDPDICHKSLGEQFDKLLEGPLQKLGDSPSQPIYVVVVDALDECQKEDDIRTLLQLWSRLSQNRYLCLRLFLTSRPELSIRLGFSRVSADAHQDVILHEVALPIIEHDISVYLADSFRRIRDEYNLAPLSGTALPGDWPGDKVLQALRDIAVPLFIIAATICRFIRDPDFDPQDQLDIVLQSRRPGNVSDLGQTYLPILERAVSVSVNKAVRQQIHQEFRFIVGAIITLAEPLSCVDLSNLLNLPAKTISLRLRPLHSVLQIYPELEKPIRPFHLSFPEFLSSDEILDQSFYIDSAATHSASVQMSRAPVSAKPCWSLQKYVPNQLPRTATTGSSLHDHPRPIITSYSICLPTLDANGSTHLTAFLKDAQRFILANRYICDLAPLQLYSSAVIFTPQSSIVKKVYSEVPSWIQRCPITPLTWSTELQKLEGHTSWIAAVVFSPDNSVLASASGDQTIRLWDAKTGQEVRKLEGHTDCVMGVVFSPDGSVLASASRDRTVRLWDTKTGQEVQILVGHTYKVCGVAFSPDGLVLASASYYGTVLLWDVKTGKKLRKLEGHADGESAVAFSPDGSVLVSASQLWDTKTGQEVRILEGHAGKVRAVAFSPDGSVLASVSRYTTVLLWDAKTWQEVRKLKGHIETVSGVAFTHDGSILASASWDRTIRLWDAKTGQEVRKLEGHTEGVNAVVFSHDGSMLASASNDGTVRLWDTKMGQDVPEGEGHTGKVVVMVFSPDGSVLASASDDDIVRLWDTKTGQELRKLEGHTSSVSAVVFSPDGSMLASASYDCTVRLWDAKTGQEVQKLEGHTYMVTAAAFSPDGSVLTSASYDGTVRLWDTKSGQEVRELEGHTGEVKAVTFTSDGSVLASASDDETVRLWDTKTGQEVQILVGHTFRVNAVVFSPDGSVLVSASDDGTVRLWHTKTGQEVQKLEGHTHWVKAVTFSPDGSVLASASDDWTVRLWDTKEGQQFKILKGRPYISKLSFSGDGQALWTNRETIYIGTAPSASETCKWKTSNNLMLTDDWIECGGQRILWLPHEYRSSVSAVYDNILAIGCASGRVSFLQIQYP